MDLLRRSFRRGSIRRRPREPLAESPSFDSPSDEPTQSRAPTSPMDRLRRSFRRNFRGCGQPVTDSSTHLPASSFMDRLRGSFRRGVGRHKSNELEMSPSEKLRRSFRRMKREQENVVAAAAASPQPPNPLAKLRRSLRRSLRRPQKEPEPSCSASRLQYWQTDEMDVRAGTCFFNVKVGTPAQAAGGRKDTALVGKLIEYNIIYIEIDLFSLTVFGLRGGVRTPWHSDVRRGV